MTKKRVLSRGIQRLNQADKRLLETLRHRGHAPFVQGPMVRLAAAAEDGALWLAIGASLAAIDPPRRRKWLVAAACGPAGIVLNFPLKLLFRRRRPQLQVERLGHAPSELSFPSAHATSSFTAATMMSRVAPRGGMLPVALACIVSAGRPYLGMHHPSDVIGGAAFGVTLGLAAHWLVERPPLAKVLE